MILVVNMCSSELSYDEFVQPIVNLVGKCDVKVCSGRRFDDGTQECDSDSECGDGVCIGVDTGLSSLAVDALNAGATTYADQRRYAGSSGANALKFLFADVMNIYKFAPGRNGAYENLEEADENYWAPYANSDLDYFVEMDPCPDNERSEADEGTDDEYCGVRPEISDIQVDGYSSAMNGLNIESGQMVELTFTSDVDDEQEPLKTIHIDWGDGSEYIRDVWNSSDGEHIYDNAFVCLPSNDGNIDGENDGICHFQPKVLLVDNWNWCSGDENNGLVLDGGRSEGGTDAFSECGTWDSVPFDIVVPQ